MNKPVGTPTYPIYDADHHYYETPDAFLRYLPKQFSKEFQYVTVNGRTKLIGRRRVVRLHSEPGV